MKAKPVKLVDGQWVEVSKEDGTHIHLVFPLSIKVGIPTDPAYEYYILRDRYLPYQLSGRREHTGNWSWNGDTEKPTIHPSILTQTRHGGIDYRCHSFVNDGVIEFLSDCTHELVGTKCELLTIE